MKSFNIFSNILLKSQIKKVPFKQKQGTLELKNVMLLYLSNYKTQYELTVSIFLKILKMIIFHFTSTKLIKTEKNSTDKTN